MSQPETTALEHERRQSLTARYETLRSCVLTQQTLWRTTMEIIVIIRSGVRTWMERSLAALASPAPPPAPPQPTDARHAQLAGVIVDMILSPLREVGT
ncbi:MAG: hypothetical protein AB1486_34610 [Planctomycetota bacterium]